MHERHINAENEEIMNMYLQFFMNIRKTDEASFTNQKTIVPTLDYSTCDSPSHQQSSKLCPTLGRKIPPGNFLHYTYLLMIQDTTKQHRTWVCTRQLLQSYEKYISISILPNLDGTRGRVMAPLVRQTQNAIKTQSQQ